jgi:Flp pilus assembly protein TadD
MAHRPRLGGSTIAAQARTISVLGAMLTGVLLSGCAGGLQDNALLSSLSSAKPADTSEPAATSKSDLEKATGYWAKEFANNPRNIDAAVNYAKNLKAMGEKDRAMAVLQQASIYNSDHKGLASEYGRSALENDQAQLAEKLLARADDPLKPDWKVISAQGAAIAKQGRHRDAVPLFERALALSPDNPSILNNLGMAQAMNGDAAKAETNLRRASELPGAPPRVRQNLALVLGLQGKFDEAKQIAGADLPPEKAAASIAYLRNMVDEPAVSGGQRVGSAPATATTGPKVAVASKKSAPKLKGTQGAAGGSDVASAGWSTEIASTSAATPSRK